MVFGGCHTIEEIPKANIFDWLRSLSVPESIHKQYVDGGKAERAKLLKLLVESGFDKDVGFIRNELELEPIYDVQSPERNEFVRGQTPNHSQVKSY